MGSNALSNWKSPRGFWVGRRKSGSIGKVYMFTSRFFSSKKQTFPDADAQDTKY